MSQSELAAALGLSTAHVGHIERGSRHASLETVVAISKHLNVSLDTLIFPQNNANPAAEETPLQQLRQLLVNAGEIIDGLETAAGD